MRRGGALIVALWIIAVLSVMVFSFAFEAHQQAGISLYVRERNRVKRLIEPARIVGEIVLADFRNAVSWTDGENPAKLDEDDRFYYEKRMLKDQSECTIGPLRLDEDDEESGTFTVKIKLVDASGLNVNTLYSGGDKKYAARWQMILADAGIDDELEVDAPTADGSGTTRHNLMNLLIASWNDWRDTDSDPSAGPLTDDEHDSHEYDGAEMWGSDVSKGRDFYNYADLKDRMMEETRDRKEREQVEADFPEPPNDEIKDVKEIGFVRGFRDFPSVITGGLLYTNDVESLENPRLKGLNLKGFGTVGSGKVNVNNPDKALLVNQLLSVPGVFDEETVEEDGSKVALEEARAVAEAIADALFVMPSEYDVDPRQSWWAYKDFADLQQRFSDYVGSSDLVIGKDAESYLVFTPDDRSVYEMTLTAESMGMKHEVIAQCYVTTNAVRYLSWQEGSAE